MVPALLGLLAAAPSVLYFSSDHWEVYQNEDNCAAIATYKRDTTMWLTYDYALQRSTFIITDPALKSVRNDSSYKLQLYFLKGDKLDDGWGEVSVDGLVLSEGEPGLRFVLKGDVALTDLASSDSIALFRDDIVVESLTLAGTTEMVRALCSCARKMQLTHPSDPLAGADENSH